MRSLLLFFTLIMMLGQTILPANASVLVVGTQHTTMNSTSSAAMAADCCKEQQHCSDCEMGMDCSNMGHCSNHCSPAVVLFTSIQPSLAARSQRIARQSWSLQTAILPLQTPPPEQIQI